MNDLTFGATLLTCFVTGVAALVIAIIWEPERTRNAVSCPEQVTVHAANTADKECTTVAVAPATTRR
jgi:hypothetical protein